MSPAIVSHPRKLGVTPGNRSNPPGIRSNRRVSLIMSDASCVFFSYTSYKRFKELLQPTGKVTRGGATIALKIFE